LSTPSTLRFTEKRETILDGAARLFNQRGIKAGTLAEVAASVGLATNSLTYYYRKKEDLVCACLMRSIEAVNAIVTRAALHADLQDRLTAVVDGYVGLMADIAKQRHPELIFFGDMRALPLPLAEPVFAAYVDMYRGLRNLLRCGQVDADADPAQRRRALNARAHQLLAQVLWSRVWLTRYESTDYPRAARCMVDILLRGLAAPGQRWPDHLPAITTLPQNAGRGGASSSESPEAQTQREAYLRTATRLINDHGVGGASVERIAATLELTKGSFYHHHETKHDLVDDCFERSFALIRGTQWAALELPAKDCNGWQRLLAATAPLVNLQVTPQGPLLRLSAWTELPGNLRWQKFTAMSRLVERYAGMLADGITDGTLRRVDPGVAAHMLSGMLNGLAEIEHWVAAGGDEPLATLYARPLLMGFLDTEQQR
jgi:AcrR family transcriptional regulator